MFRRHLEISATTLIVASCLTFSAAHAGPSARRGGQILSRKQTASFTQQLIAKERGFYRPGVAWDAKTGMTFDGHAIDVGSGKLTGSARIWSAASKESLHLIMLVKALEGDKTARGVLAPDPTKPHGAVGAALDVLAKKIATYQKFDREYPGYGGFLPWYKIEDGKMSPTADWTERVPGLDNGQLAWSLYRTADALRRLGHTELADKYQAHFDLMKRNVVDIFYDPATKKLRAEATLAHGTGTAPAQNRYINKQTNYFLDDPYEGLLLGHFADLFGDWSRHQDGKEAIWKDARRKPATFGAGKDRVTVVEGNWFSSHEEWGFLVLPFRDLPVADRLFDNAQKVRTAYSREHGWPGLFASTSTPTKPGSYDPAYLSALGVPSVSKEKVSRKRVFAPYAAFPLALSNDRLYATWMKSMLDTPGVWGENGIGESFTEGGKKVAPLLTWDGKALPLVAMMGGIGPQIAAQLKRDGVYDAFMKRVKHDYSKFDGVKLEGASVPLSAPVR